MSATVPAEDATLIMRPPLPTLSRRMCSMASMDRRMGPIYKQEHNSYASWLAIYS